MKLGVIYDGHRNFLNELLEDWQTHFEISNYSFKPVNFPLAKERINHFLHRRSLQNFINSHDVVFFEWAGPFLVIASRLRSRGSIITRLHSFELYEYAPLINWDAVDRVILVSRAMQQKFVTLYPQCKNKTEVIYNSRPLDKFKQFQRVFQGNLGMLCNLTPIKRIYEIILALPELNRRGYKLHLHIAGEPRKGGIDERYYASMQRAIDKLELQNQVKFYGFVPDPHNWFNKIDIYISNSFWEGQQVALIEAMATGCYCLSHFWDGSEEMLPGENLYSTESELLQKIITYCDMRENERETCQAQMRRLAEDKFDLERAKVKFRNILYTQYNNGKSKK